MIEDLDVYPNIELFRQSLKSTDDINKYNRIVEDLISHFGHLNLQVRINKLYTTNNELIKDLYFIDREDLNKTLRVSFRMGKIYLTKDPDDRRSYNFNNEGLLIHDQIALNDLESFGISKDLFKRHEIFFSFCGDDIDIYIIYKKFEDKEYLKEIFFIGPDISMYISCETGQIKQFIQEKDKWHLHHLAKDLNFVQQPCLEEVLESMHSHKKPILKSYESDLEK